MTARPTPQTQQEYLHGIWERLGHLEGTLEAQTAARDAAFAKQVKDCGDRFKKLEANGGSVVSVKDVRGLGKWVAPYIGKGIAIVALILGLFLAGRGQLAADVAKQVMEQITSGKNAPRQETPK